MKKMNLRMKYLRSEIVKRNRQAVGKDKKKMNEKPRRVFILNALRKMKILELNDKILRGNYR